MNTPMAKTVKYCPHCGAELPETAQFCQYCGTPLDTLRPVQKQENKGSDSETQITIFDSIQEADQWLASQDRVCVDGFLIMDKEYIHDNRASHTVAKEIMLQYSFTDKPTGWFYGLAEEELFYTNKIRKNFDVDISALWTQTYPDCELLHEERYLSSRDMYRGNPDPENKQPISTSGYSTYFILYRIRNHQDSGKKGVSKRTQKFEDFGKIFTQMNDQTIQAMVHQDWVPFLYTPFILLGWMLFFNDMRLYAKGTRDRYYAKKYGKQWLIEVLVCAVIALLIWGVCALV